MGLLSDPYFVVMWQRFEGTLWNNIHFWAELLKLWRKCLVIKEVLQFEIIEQLINSPKYLRIHAITMIVINKIITRDINRMKIDLL